MSREYPQITTRDTRKSSLVKLITNCKICPFFFRLFVPKTIYLLPSHFFEISKNGSHISFLFLSLVSIPVFSLIFFTPLRFPPDVYHK